MNNQIIFTFAAFKNIHEQNISFYVQNVYFRQIFYFGMIFLCNFRLQKYSFFIE